jgi:Glycosyltransferases, probably involved in cell wall biogenesis
VLLYWLIIIPALLLALASLLGERRRANYVLARLDPRPAAMPPATVIVPVKGYEEGLAANLASLAALDYPDFELIVTACAEEDVPPGVVPSNARLVLAGPPPPGTAEKIHNLLAAVRAARLSSVVFAFADSDGQVRPDWLRALVAALEEPGAGAATGYRWHTPLRGGFWSLLRSVWNAVIAGGFGPGQNRFAWGGAMAICRETFYSLRVSDFWIGTISDDYRLTEAVKRAGLRIVYAPAALVASADHTSGGEFLAWIRRQMLITRFYAPGLWWLGLISHIFYCAAMGLSIGLAAQGSGLALLALFVQLGAGMIKGRNRVRLAERALPAQAAWFRNYGWIHIWWTPLATWVWLYSFVASAFGRTLYWRGRSYRLTARKAPAHAQSMGEGVS